MAPRRYYAPVPRGLEVKIRDKLAHLAALDAASVRQRRKP
jgi:putative ATPase